MGAAATNATIDDAADDSGTVARPFIKWPGGKWRLCDKLATIFPPAADITGTYREPFVGAGAVAFRWAIPSGVHVAISDTEPGLIASYISVRDHAQELTSKLASIGLKMAALIDTNPVAAEALFYSVRDSYNSHRDTCDVVGVAAWFIFLHKLCFNGLHRVDARGRFNASWGKWRKPPNICDAALIAACSKALAEVEISQLDFEDAALLARRGDFVYFDPPYDGTWSGYQAGAFRGGSGQVGLFDGKEDRADIERIRDVCVELDSRGVPWAMSNADTERVRRLFARWTIHEVDAPSSISRKAESRGIRRELVVTSYVIKQEITT